MLASRCNLGRRYPFQTSIYVELTVSSLGQLRRETAETRNSESEVTCYRRDVAYYRKKLTVPFNLWVSDPWPYQRTIRTLRKRYKEKL